MLLAKSETDADRYDKVGGDRTNVSVGIAAYNEAQNIGNLIQVIQDEIEKHDQIIVVSSGSTDRTSEIVLRYSQSDHRVKLVTERDRNGKSSAINRIFAEANGEMLLLVSADVLPESGSIETMIATMQSDPMIGVVSSRPLPVNSNNNLTGYLAHLYWRLHHETLSLLDATGQNTHGGEAILVRRGIVHSIPADCINDDAYIGVETVKKGFKVKYCPQARVKTKVPTTITELFAQRRRIIAGHMKVKEQTGLYPKVLTIMAFEDPSKLVKVVSNELRSNLRSTPRFLVAVYIEAASTLLALFDRLSRRDNVIWRIAMSTKILER